jgi:hypothetical protein
MQWQMIRAASEQQTLGACIQSLQGHFSAIMAASRYHGRHLSRYLRTFLARLIVPFSSSALDLCVTSHIQRPGRSLRRYGV